MRAILDAAVDGGGLTTKFQPVVSLPTGTLVGFEALARWTSAPALDPMTVFQYAEETGKRESLDLDCVHSAAREALKVDRCRGMLLFINIEPTTKSEDLVGDHKLIEAAAVYHVVFELTERGLLKNPHGLIRKVDELRSLGSAIALDDVGVHDDSLAVLDLVEPDIVKLDMRLIQRQPDRIQARTIAAVLAHQERSGTTILAEGIETDEHFEQALAYGATLGQGFRFGRASDLSSLMSVGSWPGFQPPEVTGVTSGSVFELVANGLETRIVRKQTLLELSQHIERLAASAEISPMALISLPPDRSLSRATLNRYRLLAQKSSFMAVFGSNIPDTLDPHVRRFPLDGREQLAQEWAVFVLGPDIAAGIVARKNEPSDPLDCTADPRFTMAMTFDRSRVASATRMLLDRTN